MQATIERWSTEMQPPGHGLLATFTGRPEHLYAGAMAIEPRVHGELGYREWCVLLVEAAICSCDGCGGHLVDGVCESCGCRHSILEPSGFNRQRYAAWSPVHKRGRCTHADTVRDQEERERERQARKRLTAEELGDPQR